jgi:RHS repeat-associated protein
LIHSTGTTPNNYLFAGEEFDPDLHLYYNRARYLNTSTGRFWSMDSFEGLHDQPLSLHKYLYARANSVNRRDPTGKDDIEEELTAASEQQTLGANLSAEAQQLGTEAESLATEAPADLAEAAAPAEEGEAAESAAEAAQNQLKVTEKGLKYIAERHLAGGARTAGKSLFNAGEDIRGLVQAGENVNPVQQLGGNFERIIDAGRDIGIDRVTGAATQCYTVITNAAGEVVTAFPGVPVAIP